MSGIAIIGMAGRFPGARTVQAFWANLVNGVEAIRRSAAPASAGFVPAVASMDGVDQFDAPFFGISPAFAEIMDPQHRVFMEVGWEAFEDAGYDPTTYRGAVGVYAGATANTYFAVNLASNAGVLARFSPIDLNTHNANDFLTTRLSYVAGLTGPSHAVQCACSTSLVAVCLACQALTDGMCDIAVAGGVSVNVTHLDGYRFIDGGMFSPDGHCRPFSAAASGTVFGNGAGAVVLKPIDEARRDGDHVYAVIAGCAINNDGRRKAGYLAPGVDGQAQVVAEALGHAGLSADAIGFVEAHGTATPLGDPIEVRALTKAFRESTARTQFCRLGSVKGNVGHLDAAAGVAGLIKATMVVADGIVPPTLHDEAISPALEIDQTPFVVNRRCEKWGSEGLRRAGVSAFGVGGTNAHVVLEQAPESQPSDRGAACHVLPISARSVAALRAASANLAHWLRDHPDANLADVAYTLQVGRRRFGARRAIASRSIDEAIASLDRAFDAIAAETDDTRPIGFVFTGTPSDGAPSARLAAALAPYAATLSDLTTMPIVPAVGGNFLNTCAVASCVVGLGLRPDATFGDDDWADAEAIVTGRLTSRDLWERLRSGHAHVAARSALDRARRWAAERDGLLVMIAGPSVSDKTSIDLTAVCASEHPLEDVMAGVGEAWVRGAAVDWTRAYGAERRLRVSLPTYPFEHRRYWIDAPGAADRVASPAVSASAPRAPRPALPNPYEPPATPLQAAIASVWGQALGIADLGIDDDFFALGGDSLLAVRVAGDLTRALDRSVAAPSIYEALTIRRLARALAPDDEASGGDDAREAVGQLRQSRRARAFARRASNRASDAAPVSPFTDEP